MVGIGRGVSASIGVWGGGCGMGDALIAGLNQCRGGDGGVLLTQHSTIGGVALCRGGGDGLVVWLLRKLMCRWRWLSGRNRGRGTERHRWTSMTRQTSIRHHNSRNSGLWSGKILGYKIHNCYNSGSLWYDSNNM